MHNHSISLCNSCHLVNVSLDTCTSSQLLVFILWHWTLGSLSFYFFFLFSWVLLPGSFVDQVRKKQHLIKIVYTSWHYLQQGVSLCHCLHLSVKLSSSLSMQVNKLLEVTSNIWGTKFKIHALSAFLPEDLGHILYKTSLLHLQPRQMTISIVELGELRPQARDPNYCPTQFSESEDEGTGEGAWTVIGTDK